MKTIHQFMPVLLAYMFCATTFAQVYTPNDTPVEYIIQSGGNVALLEDAAADFLMIRGWTNLVTKTAPATNEYNCHSFTWNMSEGGITCWINEFTEAVYGSFFDNPGATLPLFPDNIKKYWDDGSYISVPENQATKIWYGMNWIWGDPFLHQWNNVCDHSAIRITSGTHAGKYESKWGSWPRYIHPADKTPYVFSYSYAHFFKRAPYFSGPSYVCTSGIVYTLHDPPSGSITWTVTGPFTLAAIPYKPAEIIVNRIGSNTGSGTLKATISGNSYTKNIEASCVTSISGPDIVCYSPGSTFSAIGAPVGFTWDKSSNLTLTGSGNSVTVSKSNNWSSSDIGWVSIKDNGKELVRKNVWADTPVIDITPSDPDVSIGGYETFYAIPVSALSSPSTYNWVISRWPAGQHTYDYTTNNWIEYYFPSVGSFQIGCRAENTCGYGEWYTPIDFSISYRSPSYPNPVSDILTIEIADTPANKTSNATHGSYDIRLYDGQGNLMRQKSTNGGNVQFNVENLPNGIYYLHIYDGINNMPEMQQIVVGH